MANIVIVDNTERWTKDIQPRLLSLLEECQAIGIPFVFSCNFVIGTERCETQTYTCVSDDATQALFDARDILRAAAAAAEGMKNV